MQLVALTTPLPALSELDAAGSSEWSEGLGLPAYRVKQLSAALHRRFVQTFDDLTEYPKDLREHLAGRFRLRTLEVRVHLRSRVDGAEKVLFALSDGQAVETVLIRGRNAGGAARSTVCVSSQVGCPAGCTFCATGLSGFGRNLSAAEIIDQVEYFAAQLRPRGERVTNVVFMGMGEPLLNVKAVRGAVGLLTSPGGFGLGARSTTVSTVGIVPQMRRFADWAGQVNLAVSLHAPNDDVRSRLVPYNQHFPVADLLAAVQEYIDRTRRRVSFEYVLLKGVNDDLGLADELASLVAPLRGMAHVNLIPWNPFKDGHFVRSEGPDADAFARVLLSRGVNATIRYSKGLDISAACGQLREREVG
jgi:23S rRNA (adenine2503-C2)-methyltransferase